MKPSAMNKTTIISYIIDESIKNLRNVSSLMRKRVNKVIENMEVIVKECNEKALNLNQWVKTGVYEGTPIEEVDQIKQGVCDYRVATQEQLDKIVSFNGKLRCYSINFSPEKPLDIEKLYYLRVDQSNCNAFLSCSFGSIKHLTMTGLFKDQIEAFLAKTKNIHRFSIFESELSNLDFRPLNTKTIFLIDSTFTDTVTLPNKLDCLKVSSCKGLEFLKVGEVVNINLPVCHSNSKGGETQFIKGLKNVKTTYIESRLTFSEYLVLLPPTVREIEYAFTDNCNNIDPVQMKKCLPNLIKVEPSFPVEIAQTLNLRNVYPKMQQTEEKFTFRPRKISIGIDNVCLLNKHPELFEEAENVVVQDQKFNLDCLTKKIKKIEFMAVEIQS